MVLGGIEEDVDAGLCSDIGSGGGVAMSGMDSSGDGVVSVVGENSIGKLCRITAEVLLLISSMPPQPPATGLEAAPAAMADPSIASFATVRDRVGDCSAAVVAAVVPG